MRPCHLSEFRRAMPFTVRDGDRCSMRQRDQNKNAIAASTNPIPQLIRLCSPDLFQRGNLQVCLVALDVKNMRLICCVRRFWAGATPRLARLVLSGGIVFTGEPFFDLSNSFAFSISLGSTVYECVQVARLVTGRMANEVLHFVSNTTARRCRCLEEKACSCSFDDREGRTQRSSFVALCPWTSAFAARNEITAATRQSLCWILSCLSRSVKRVVSELGRCGIQKL